MSIATLFQSNKPAIPLRVVQLDLKGMPPTPARLLSLLEVFAAARYNAIMVEWEDAFPWAVDERFRSETAYTPDQVAQFHATAEDLGLEIIPLVQCIGHTETPLSVAGYENLREVPYQSDVLNPLAPGARELIERMIDDVLERTPKVRYFHLGGDEARSLGTRPETRAYIEKHGKGALYLQHIEPILSKLNDRGIRPILWHDMMVDWEPEVLKALGRTADLIVWGYREHPDVTPHHYKTVNIERLKENGITLWGAGSYKGGDGLYVDLPDYEQRQSNAMDWVEIAQRYDFAGLVATGWSRASTHRVQRAPTDSALDCLLNVGVIFHDGKPPDAGRGACLAALSNIGERERFEACRAAMEKLAHARRTGWETVAVLREHIVMATLDARRRNGGKDLRSLGALHRTLLDGVAAGRDVRKAFAELIEPIWVERYVAERIEPLREEFHAIAPRIRQLNPQGYDAQFHCFDPPA